MGPRDLAQDTLERRRRILGDDHPDTLASASDLATFPRAPGELDESDDRQQEARRRRHPQGLSADMLRAVQLLRAAHRDLGVPLRQELDRVTDPRFARPAERGAERGQELSSVHFGAIGSADRLLRDARLRDELASRYGVRGVEMEASGLAVGAHLRGVPWFVVRGISDFCDNAKDDNWRYYASLTSAAFVAIMLRHCRPLAQAHSTR